MKISIKLLFLFSTLVLALSLEIKKEFEKGPIYEIPFIKKNDSPVSNNFNPRIENINLSSQEKYAKKKFYEAKDTFRANLIRDFSISNLLKWTNHIEKEKIDRLEEHEIIDNISAIKVYSRALQERINDIGNKLKTQVGLLDIVLKEKNVIASKIMEIQIGNSNSSEECERLEHLRVNEKVANTALKQEVKDVLHEIEKVKTAVNKLEKDEKNQNNIVQTKKNFNKLKLEGQYFDPKKKKSVEKDEDNLKKIAEATSKLGANQNLNLIHDNHKILRVQNKAAEIANKFLKHSEKLDQNLDKISHRITSENFSKSKEDKIKKIVRKITNITSEVLKSVTGPSPFSEERLEISRIINSLMNKARNIEIIIAKKNKKHRKA